MPISDSAFFTVLFMNENYNYEFLKYSYFRNMPIQLNYTG